MPKLREIEENLVRVTGLQLKSFRGFRFMDLQLEQAKPVNVLIADNGGGKTTILDAVAGFLIDFLNQTILNENKISEESTSKNWKSKDVKNGDAVAYCKATLALTYWHPSLELLEVIPEITEFLNEYELSGDVAWLNFGQLEEGNNNETWFLQVNQAKKGSKDDDYISLPDNILKRLDQVARNIEGNDKGEEEARKLSPDDRFIVAIKMDKDWEGNVYFEEANQQISKVKYSGSLDLEVEINRSGVTTSAHPVIPKYNPEKSKCDNIEIYLTNLRKGVAFLEDFRCSVQDYNSENTHTTLPILVYYGGSAINTKFGEVGIRYIEQPYQAYKNALQPNRFDFEDFFEWLNWIKSNEPNHVFNRVEETILSALNADESIYKVIRIEQGQLWVDKVYQKDGSPQSVEVSQLSAGEKNLFALVGDLVKRALQLNPVLFEIDYDENVGTFSNPLEYTRGIVLIDEADLHLHPNWQREVIPTLQKLFPNIQFLVTTHSPFILQSIKPEFSVITAIENFQIRKLDGVYHYGMDISSISYSLQGVSMQLEELAPEIEEMYRFIDLGKLKEAKEKIASLKRYLSETHEDIIKAQTYIEFYLND